MDDGQKKILLQIYLNSNRLRMRILKSQLGFYECKQILGELKRQGFVGDDGKHVFLTDAGIDQLRKRD